MLRQRGGSLSNKTDLKDLEEYYKSLKKNVVDQQFDFQIKRKEKSRNLIINLREKRFEIFKSSKKGQRKHIKKFNLESIIKIIKDKVNNKQLTLHIKLDKDSTTSPPLTSSISSTPSKKPSKKDISIQFQNAERRECFYELLWLDKLNKKVPEQEEKVTYEKIEIFVSTWNMGDAPPPSKLDQWLPVSSEDKKYDIIAIGVQECEYSPRGDYKDCEQDWFKTLEQHLGDDYYEISSTSLVKMRIIIFSRRIHASKFNYIQKTSIPTGIAGVYGNKGATLISFQFLETSFCFINSHFAAHQEKIESRNNNYRDIIKGADQLGYESMDIINQFSHVFWMGDFNYRIDLFREEVLLNIRKKNLSKLLAADQLLSQKSQDKVFYGFKEEKLNFYPTYKMDRGIEGSYSEEKQRVPSWCDRILYKSLPYCQPIKPLRYTSAPKILTSDHRPVYGIFETLIQLPCLPLPLADAKKKCSILFQDLRAENLDLIDQNLPDPYLIFNSCSFIESSISTAHASKNRSPNWGDIPAIQPSISKQSFLETQHLYITIFHGQHSDNDKVIKLGHCTIPLALGFSKEPFNFATRITKNGLPSGILYGRIQIIYSQDNISSPKLIPTKTIKLLNFKPMNPDLSKSVPVEISPTISPNHNNNNNTIILDQNIQNNFNEITITSETLNIIENNNNNNNNKEITSITTSTTTTTTTIAPASTPIPIPTIITKPNGSLVVISSASLRKSI